jgi:hypothetical protein
VDEDRALDLCEIVGDPHNFTGLSNETIDPAPDPPIGEPFELHLQPEAPTAARPR